MRKKIFAVVFICLTFFNNRNIYAIDLSANEISILKDQLDIIGLKSSYAKNIVSYVKNLEVSEKEIEDITKSSDEIKSLIGNKKSFSDFTVNQLFTIYNKSTKVADKLDLGIAFNIINQTVTIKDKNTSNVLLKADSNDIDKYISNIKTVDSEKNINLLASIIKDNISVDKNSGVNDTEKDTKLVFVENPVVYSVKEENVVNSNEGNSTVNSSGNSVGMETDKVGGSDEGYDLAKGENKALTDSATVLANEHLESTSKLYYKKASFVVMLISLVLATVLFIKIILIRIYKLRKINKC